MTKKKWKILLWVLVPLSLIVFALISPQFLFRQTRISYELNKRVDFSAQLDINSRDVEIVDFQGRWYSMYGKLRITMKDYDHVKKRFLLNSGTVSNKDFAGEIMNLQSGYHYDEKGFHSVLSVVKNAKRVEGLLSMNLDDYEELLIVDAMYGKWFTTGGTFYILVKENNVDYFVYVLSFV